jgi:hypothetical protein
MALGLDNVLRFGEMGADPIRYARWSTHFEAGFLQLD